MADQASSTVPEATEKPATSVVDEQKTETPAVVDAPAKSETAETNTGVSEEPVKEETASEPVQPAASDAPAADKAEVDEEGAAKTGAPVSDVAETAPETVEKSGVDTASAPAQPATPATGKKSNGSSSSKKKNSVPEHKSKKLNKKKSVPVFHVNCQPGEMYLARMKGHAPWPSIICDEELLPASLINSRPVTTTQPDGTFKRPDYAPGGKRQGERTYPIMFLYTNEFAWLANVDLTPITPEECKNVEEKGKSKSLIAAYGVAAENHDLQYFKTMLADHQAAIQADFDAQAEREAERAAAKAAAKSAKAEKKASRKSITAADDDNDDMDVAEDGEEEKPKNKKRKKAAAEGDEDGEEKPAKTPKLKLNGPKTPSTDKKAAKPKSSKKAAAKKDSDEDMPDADAPVVQAEPLTAAEIKDKKEKEIRYYRHKLQRGLLSRDDAPSDEEANTASGYLGKLEVYPDLEGDIIRSTKIHKVLRAIIRLPSIPNDETLNLKKRSNDLLQKWNSILGTEGATETGDTSVVATEQKKPDTSIQPSIGTPAQENGIQEEKKDTVSALAVQTNGTADGAVTKPEETKEAESTPAVVSEPAKSSDPVVEKPADAAASTTESKPAESTDKPVESSA